jgi:hypothetical protein
MHTVFRRILYVCIHTQICIKPERDAGLGALREGKRKAKTRQGRGKKGGSREGDTKSHMRLNRILIEVSIEGIDTLKLYSIYIEKKTYSF